MPFSGVIFDIDNKGDFYVSYEADTLIYVYDHDYKPITSFGYSGIDLDTEYMIIEDFETSRKNYRNMRNTKGFYKWLEYDSSGLIFRSYSKGENNIADGLQIYKDYTLIGDVEVPKGFRVAGKIDNYFYSYIIIDEEKSNMRIYRFELDE